MRINIENCVRCCGATSSYKFALTELVQNMKELRKRTSSGDMSVIDEFFNIYTFDVDDKVPK